MKNQLILTQKTNVIGRYALILLAGFFLSLISCKKKDNPSIPAKPDDIYLGGSFNEVGTQYPAYWKNGEKFELLDLDGNKTAGNVNAITVNGTDVYSVGYCSSKSGQILLWKNEKAIRVTQDSEPDAGGNSIAVAKDGTVYVGGAQHNANNKYFPRYWKINGNTSVPSKDLSQGAYLTKHVYGSDIALLDNKVYMTGTINEVVNQAALWTDDGTTISEKILNNTLSDANGSGIVVSGNDVYIGGYEYGVVKFWRNDKNDHVDLSATGTSFAGLSGIAIDANNKVHMAGFDISSTPHKAMYWKEGSEPVILTAPSATMPEYASSIAIAGNNVYITGYFNPTSNNTRSILWMNGKKVPGFEGSQDINAKALFVVKK